MPRIVMHMDLNAFFASAEERERPELKGRPLVVGADPKGGHGRGVVSTASYAARKYGIRSGMPISRAWKLCPGAPHGPCVYLPVNFKLYTGISANVMEILRCYGDSFEPAGIDEAYLEVSRRAGSWEKALDIAEKIKKDIREKEGLTCSIGIAPNKLVAKIASDFRKPDGLTLVRPEDVLDFLRPMEPRALPGIGPKTYAVLKGMEITTVGRLRRLRKDQLTDMFGKFGATMWEYARGIDDSPLIESWEPKSIGKHFTFEKDTRDRQLLHRTLENMANEIRGQLDESRYMYRTVTLMVRYENFDTHGKSKTLELPIADMSVAVDIAKELLKKFLEDDRKIRLVGLTVSKLSAR